MQTAKSHNVTSTDEEHITDLLRTATGPSDHGVSNANDQGDNVSSSTRVVRVSDPAEADTEDSSPKSRDTVVDDQRIARRRRRSSARSRGSMSRLSSRKKVSVALHDDLLLAEIEQLKQEVVQRNYLFNMQQARFFRENIGYSVGSMGNKLVMVLRMKDHSLDNFRRVWKEHGFDKDVRHMVRTWGRVQKFCLTTC